MLNNFEYASLKDIAPNTYIDLHIHTIYSDGELDVPHILKIANRTGLKLISITDHNTLNAYTALEQIDVQNFYNGKILTGVEINLLFNGQLLEGLAYGFDLNKLRNINFFKDDYSKKMQHEIAKDLFELAQTYHIRCDESFLSEPFTNGVRAFFDEIHSHAENQDFIKQNKLVRMRDFFRNHYTNPKGLFYIDFYKYYYTFADMKKIVNDAGGILVLAHPIGTYLLKNERKIIKKIVHAKAVDGIEVIHYNMNLQSTNFCSKIANKHHLIKTCGSDFHKRNHVMGYADKSNLKTMITK